uniref:F-box domain-containing protein n=2 Tax=Caenorhabditis tropicalis TaxID=1561998 RepID=A0A1I7UF97_9PELO
MFFLLQFLWEFLMKLLFPSPTSNSRDNSYRIVYHRYHVPPLKFPLLKLPLLAIDSVISSMGIHDIIEFSNCSKRANRFLSRIKKKKYEMNVKIWNDKVHLIILDQKNEFGTWIFKKCKEGRREKTRLITEQWSTSITVPCLHSKYINRNLMECAKEKYASLKSQFNCSVNTIFFKSYGETDSTFFQLSEFGSVNELNIEGTEMIRNENLKSLLSSCHVSEYIFMNVPIEESFRFEINEKDPTRIEIWMDSHWITDEILLSLKYDYLILYRSQLSLDACFSFINQWLHSENTSFFLFYSRWETNQLPEEMDINRLGVNLMPFDRQRRNPLFRHKHYAVQMETGIDFIREEDGLLASIRTDENSLLFCVWHDRFPGTENIKLIF